MSTDTFFLPGVSFTLDGETLPARELSWAMYASCGCVSALHMITEDTITEAAAWKQLSGNARMIERDRERGFTIRLVKHRDIPFGECPHSPRYGYMPPPKPIGHSWATTSSARTLHLVPLVPLDDEQAKELRREWVDESWRGPKVASVCGKASELAGVWTRKWYRLDGKPECKGCISVVEKQVLL